jgi:hypothetical protein
MAAVSLSQTLRLDPSLSTQQDRSLAYAHFEILLRKVQCFEKEKEALVAQHADVWMVTQEATDRIETIIATTTNAPLHEACKALREVMANPGGAEELLSIEDVVATPEFGVFAQLQSVPKNLKCGQSLLPLSKFVEAMTLRSSPDAVALSATLSIRKSFIQETFPATAEGLRVSEQFSRQVDEARAAALPWLAQSDHDPVLVALKHHREPVQEEAGQESSLNDLLSVRVVSHNVQERTTNGIATFVTSGKFLAGLQKGSARQLAAHALHNDVRLEHRRCVVEFVKRELQRAEIVCLQELSRDVVDAIACEVCKDASSAEGPWIHASSNLDPCNGVDCAAITCIVSNVPIRKRPDVVVTVAQATKVNTRRFATAHVPRLNLVVSSIHVRHAANSAAEAGGNVANIEEAVGKLAKSLFAEPEPSDHLRAASSDSCGLLAVGDFNGDISHVTSFSGALAGTLCAVPPRPTAFGGRKAFAIDGGIFIPPPPNSTSASDIPTPIWSLDCTPFDSGV